MARRVCKFPQVTADRMVACAAVGTTYHAAHPKPGQVWAIDDRGVVRVVRIDMKHRLAEIVATWSEGHEFAYQPDQPRRIMSFGVPAAVSRHYGISMLDAALGLLPDSIGSTDPTLFEVADEPASELAAS